jgi:hypothetical protein
MAVRGTPAPLRGIRWPFSFCVIYSGLPVTSQTGYNPVKRQKGGKEDAARLTYSCQSSRALFFLPGQAATLAAQ